jgi:spermidine/putrescine transport system substrate-binding protein
MTDPRFNDPITRSQLLRRAAAGGAALTLPSLIAACGGSSGIQGQANTSATTTQIKRQLASTLRFSDWPEYIDVDDKGNRPSLDQFTKQTGVKVKYIEDINDNDSFFGKIQGPLSHGQPIGRDIIVLTDSSGLPARMIKLGWLEKLDKQSIPNMKNLQDALAHPTWDKNRDYSLPWQSGMTGIGYDPKRTGGDITTIDQLLTDPKLKGKVTLLTEMSDTVGVVMQANGDDPTSVTDESFDRAIKTIQDAVDSGQVRQFTGNDYITLLPKGDAWASLSWSGDLVQLQADNPNLKWNLADSGGMIWTDNMLIPKGGDVYTASVYMNFVYDPEIAAEIEDWVNYICPVKGADKVLLAQDPDVAKNTLIFPTDEMLANVKIFDAKALNNKDYKEKFQALIGA